MTRLDYLGGALEHGNFLKACQNVWQNKPFARLSLVLFEENEKIIAHGTAEEIKDSLKSKYNRKIIKWDAYYHVVVLKI